MDNKMAANAALGSATASSNAYQSSDPYKDSNPFKDNNPYKNQNPYKEDDVYKKRKEEKEPRKFWTLDFEIARFFRENYNAGVDFEESPRAFFDAEYMFNLRYQLLKRNMHTFTVKLLAMLMLSVFSLFVPFEGVMLLGFIYAVVFLYFIAVPMAFVKYTRQYIADDTNRGKLKKVHDTYSKWMKPLESVTMNGLTIIFIAIQITMYLNIPKLFELMQLVAAYTKTPLIINYVNAISFVDMKNSISVAIVFYAISYLLYWFSIYKLWSPKWEIKRKENEMYYIRTNQRTARNLRDELVKDRE